MADWFSEGLTVKIVTDEPIGSWTATVVRLPLSGWTTLEVEKLRNALNAPVYNLEEPVLYMVIAPTLST